MKNKKQSPLADFGIMVDVPVSGNIINAKLKDMKLRKTVWSKQYPLGTSFKLICQEAIAEKTIQSHQQVPLLISKDDYEKIMSAWAKHCFNLT